MAAEMVLTIPAIRLGRRLAAPALLILARLGALLLLFLFLSHNALLL
jgi:hypothetical protein